MPYECPKCLSNKIATSDYARRICAIIGAIAGAISASVDESSELVGGARFFELRRKISLAPGRCANRVINALVLSMAGGTAGAKLGEFIDARILRNFYCQDCQHRFSAEEASCEEEYDDRQYFHAHAKHAMPKCGSEQGERPRQYWAPQDDRDELD